VEEKESKIKETMKMMGLFDWVCIAVTDLIRLTWV
jgi:hypothetical protein